MSHAYLVYGSLESGKATLFAEMEKRNIEIAPADVWVHSVDGGTIDDVRMMRREAFQKPVTSTHRLVIFSAATLHEEAQQTLLKVFEEPGDTVIVALIVPAGTPILPTVLSRVQILHAEDGQVVLPFTTKEFLSAAPKDRLEMLGDIFDEDNEQEKSQVIALMDALESHFVALAKKGDKEIIAALADIEKMRPYLFQKGGVAKYVLEYLAVALPKSA